MISVKDMALFRSVYLYVVEKYFISISNAIWHLEHKTTVTNSVQLHLMVFFSKWKNDDVKLKVTYFISMG